jgi:hypothetical protein
LAPLNSPKPEAVLAVTINDSTPAEGSLSIEQGTKFFV